MKTTSIYIFLLFNMLALSLGVYAKSDESGFIAQSDSFSMHKVAQNLCHSAQNNDLISIRKQLLNEKLHIRNIYSSIRCNGQDLLTFAADNKASRVKDYFLQKLALKESGGDLYADTNH
jgi:hypothetical protein